MPSSVLEEEDNTSFQYALQNIVLYEIIAISQLEINKIINFSLIYLSNTIIKSLV